MTGTYLIGTNYDPTTHSVGFWVAFLTVASVGVVALMALFMYAVARASQATRPAVPDPVDVPTPAPEIGHAA